MRTLCSFLIFFLFTTNLQSRYLALIWTAQGVQADEQFGSKAYGAEDLNGDGFSDLVVGAPGYAGGRGRALVYFGSKKGLPKKADWVREGESAAEAYGMVVGGAGDVNGDGYDDLFINAMNFKGHGKIEVFHGGPKGLKGAPDWTGEGIHAAENFGDCASPAGDVNGDGYADLAVGAFGFDAMRGRVLLYLGSALGLVSQASWEFKGKGQGDELGYGLGPAGDVNGDGFDDLIFSGKKRGLGKLKQAGEAYLFLGSAKGLEKAPFWTGQGKSTGAIFGQKVGSLGDLNHDGFADFFVSAPGDEGRRGSVSVYLGGKKPAQGPAWVGKGESKAGELGSSAAPAGDLSGAGHADLVAGSPGLGRAYVYFGELKGEFSRSNWAPPSAAIFDRQGSHVSALGDSNGNGHQEILVSSEAFNGGLERQGRVQVFESAIKSQGSKPPARLQGSASRLRKRIQK